MRFQPTQTVNFIFWSLFRASQIAKKSVLAFPVSRCKDSGHAKACTPNGHGLLLPHSVEAVGGVHPLWGPPDTGPFPRQPWLPAEATVGSRLWILSNSHGSYRHENLGDRTWTSLAWKRLVFLGQFLEPNAAVFHLTLIPLKTDGASCRKFEGSFQNLAVASTVSDIILNIYYNLIPVLRLILR